MEKANGARIDDGNLRGMLMALPVVMMLRVIDGDSVLFLYGRMVTLMRRVT